MSLRNNRDSLVANLVQQACGLLIFLVVPHLLPVDHYGQITYVSTLLSFIGIADLGISYVYARSMPAVYGRNNSAEIASWNSNTLRFRLYCSMVFAVIITTLYYCKYQNVFNTCLLFPVAPMTTLVGFGIATYTAQANFSIPRNINITQALVRLIAIPGVRLVGLTGWFLAQLIALVAVFANRDYFRRIVQSWREGDALDFKRICGYLPEAISLGIVATLWLQLISSAKLFAVISYSDLDIAKYGLATTAYQLISTALVAAFAPQAVKTYRMLEENQQATLDYTFKTILLAFPIIAVLSVSVMFMAPYFFKEFFPKYAVGKELLNPILLSLMSYPAIIVLGAVLIGTKRSYQYLFLVVSTFIIGCGIFKLLQPIYGNLAAAHTQFILIALYATLLILLVYFYFRTVIRRAWMVLLVILSNMLAPVLYYSSSYFLH